MQNMRPGLSYMWERAIMDLWLNISLEIGGLGGLSRNMIQQIPVSMCIGIN